MNVLTSTQMREWEKTAVASGVSVADLMETAVAGCLRIIQEAVPHPRPTIVLCGKGNNGNDGLALAYELEKRGWPVEVFLTHPPRERAPHPLPHLGAFLQGAATWPAQPEEIHHPKLVIDALLGLGAKGAIGGVMREMLEWCRIQKKNRDVYVSIDLPSGLDPDTGKPDEVAFQADITCAIGAVKQGCVADAALPFVGKIETVPLPQLPFLPTNQEWMTKEVVATLARRLPIGIHKHSRGRVNIWAGSVGMLGAAELAARAALRGGAGLVKLYLPPELFAAVQTPEIITRAAPTNAPLSDDFFECHACVIGPGLGRDDTTRNRFFDTLHRLKQPAVFDADALYFLSTNLEQLEQISAPFILTPHTGEMERLCGTKDNRAKSAADWTQKHRGVLVLKGPHTVVAEQNRPLSFNGSGNPGMATAGMGDALAGMLGSLLAQSYAPWDAARLGVFWHGLAADIAARAASEQSIIASDVIEHLGAAWRALLE
ncbi:MAG: NAD(P)H-hydrate dehydratase [bacterium]